MSEQRGSEITRADEAVDGEGSYRRARLDIPRDRQTNRWGHGLVEWLLRRGQASVERPARLAILARIPLGPRQALALVEAEGLRLLVGTSADSAPSFLPLYSGSAGAFPAAYVSSATPSSGMAEQPSGSPGRLLDRKDSERRGRRLGFTGRVSW